jgi:lauroyl/myristoyl acyltransferase/mitochondrial fission protein ELM1
LSESILCFLIKGIAIFIRMLPLSWALSLGKALGILVYYFDTKHRALAYANLKEAFSTIKSPDEIKRITKTVFTNYGQNLIELLRLPLINKDNFNKYITIEGREYVDRALAQGKGCIITAMHFGSWEMANLSCASLGYPYKFFVKEQSRNLKLDALLNSYRRFGGSEVLLKSTGTRDFLRALHNNELIGMVIDQGGRDGTLVPLFGRKASMSVGAIRIGLKQDIPVIFGVIYREGGAKHRMILKPFHLIKTNDVEKDIVTNLSLMAKAMEDNIRKRPEEYMWFYKIWKYSKEAHITVLSDEKTGHLRQSENVAQQIKKALLERDITATTQIVNVTFKSLLAEKMLSILSVISNPFFHQGRLQFLRLFLNADSFQKVAALKTDYVVSCGASLAPLNYFVARDLNAKSVVVLRPGILNYNRFDMVVLPQHDWKSHETPKRPVVVTHAAPNLISPEYLNEQKELLLKRFTHLRNKVRLKIGLLIGGESKNVYLSDQQIRILINQLKETARAINADVVITTSRRTPSSIEQMLFREFKKETLCPLLILANQENVPEAMGGILGLSDIVIVSGDSISMVSEAASSGKNVIVFYPQGRTPAYEQSNKFKHFIDQLNEKGYVISCYAKDIGQAVFNVAKNKIQSKRLDDNDIIFEAARFVI